MYSIEEASSILGVHPNTLRRWERIGKISPYKTEGGHRRYSPNELLRINPTAKLANTRITIGYCRVSSSDQKEDLKRQIEYVSTYCISKGYSFQVIDDVGSGLNYNKKGLRKLINQIQSNEVERIVINYKDRLIRFGFEIIEQLCEFHDVKIEIINHTKDRTYEQEMVEDILSVVTVFSARLYGSRSHKQKRIVKTTKEVLEE
jgi:putative resolvase